MGEGHSLAALRRSESGIVVAWLLKVAIVLLVVGLILFEAFAVVLVRATAADTASKAAQEAGFAYRSSNNLDRAKQTAKNFAESEGTEFVGLSVDDRAKTITVTVRKTAKTLLIQSIGAFKKYTTVEATQTAPLPS